MSGLTELASELDRKRNELSNNEAESHRVDDLMAKAVQRAEYLRAKSRAIQTEIQILKTKIDAEVMK